MDFKLQPNEGVLIQSINIKRVGASDFFDELILTNLNIIYVDRGKFRRKVINVIYYPIVEIKRLKNKPQISFGLNGKNGSPQLQIYFNNGKESFEFARKSKKEINKWIKAINSLVQNKTIERQSKAIPGVKVVTETIRDTFGVIANTLTENLRKKQIITTKCIGCYAPLTGGKNETVVCKYCNTKQKIK